MARQMFSLFVALLQGVKLEEGARFTSQPNSAFTDLSLSYYCGIPPFGQGYRLLAHLKSVNEGDMQKVVASGANTVDWLNCPFLHLIFRN